jgi:2-polyprenyl-3-methyl-5-hydroxy-6-metoxy-1,4-benzoquinol methylase
MPTMDAAQVIGVRRCPLCQNSEKPVLCFRETIAEGHKTNWSEPWKTGFRSVRVVKCAACAFSYVWEDIPSELLVAHYQHPMDISVEFARRESKHDLYAAILSQFSRKGRLLDIGCWEGALLWTAKQQGWEVVGVEIDTKCATFVRETLGFPVVNGFLHTAGFGPDTFDGVTLIDVLEHVKDPVQALVEIRRVLKPGGELVISVPSAPFQYLKEKWARRLIGDVRTVADVVHLNQFTSRTLTFALQRAGLQPITLGVPPIRYHPRAYKGVKFRLMNLVRRSYYVFSKVLNSAGIPAGASILAVAKKPELS